MRVGMPMDPISTATTFATIVSLMADFVSHRGANQSKSFDEFMAWLSEQRHDEIRGLLQANAATVVSIKALLNESRQQVLDRLSTLDKSLASVASGFDFYRDIAQAAHPETLLSSQAISLLEQFYDAGASGMLEGKMSAGIVLLFLDGKRGTATFSEPRFVEDDLNILVDLRLLDLTHNSKGERVFKFKRTAAALVEQRRGA
jgi:hypothetical protein